MTTKKNLNLELIEEHVGFLPPKQLRGKRSADALLESGRLLLRTHTMEDLTIQQLCDKANLTTGAFYRRFVSKDAYFKALQAFAIQDASEGYSRLLALLDEREWLLDEGILLIVSNIRLWYCKHEGIVRASQMHRRRDALSWEPIKQAGSHHVNQLVQRVAKMCCQPNSTDLLLRISFGFQVVFGTMTNAVINNPGPLDLANKTFEVELSRIFCGYLSKKAA